MAEKHCTYCGLRATSVDHIPPQAMRSTIKDLGQYQGIWKEVPACIWCNSILGHQAFLTVQDRRDFIKKMLRKKFKKLLQMPTWSNHKLSELSESLRVSIIDAMQRRDLVRKRLAWKGIPALIILEKVENTSGELQCMKCLKRWWPTMPRFMPKQCPGCKSRLWNGPLAKNIKKKRRKKRSRTREIRQAMSISIRLALEASRAKLTLLMANHDKSHK